MPRKKVTPKKASPKKAATPRKAAPTKDTAVPEVAETPAKAKTPKKAPQTRNASARKKPAASPKETATPKRTVILKKDTGLPTTATPKKPVILRSDIGLPATGTHKKPVILNSDTGLPTTATPKTPAAMTKKAPSTRKEAPAAAVGPDQSPRAGVQTRKRKQQTPPPPVQDEDTPAARPRAAKRQKTVVIKTEDDSDADVRLTAPPLAKYYKSPTRISPGKRVPLNKAHEPPIPREAAVHFVGRQPKKPSAPPAPDQPVAEAPAPATPSPRLRRRPRAAPAVSPLPETANFLTHDDAADNDEDDQDEDFAPVPVHAIYDDGRFRRQPQLDDIPAHITATSGPPLDRLQRNLETLRAVALGMEDEGVLSGDEARLVLERWLHNVRFTAHKRKLIDDEGWVARGDGGWLKSDEERRAMVAWRAEWLRCRFAGAVAMLVKEKALGWTELAAFGSRWIGFYATGGGEQGEEGGEGGEGEYEEGEGEGYEDGQEGGGGDEEEYEDEPEGYEEQPEGYWEQPGGYEEEPVEPEYEPEYEGEAEAITPAGTRAQRQARRALRGQLEESSGRAMRATTSAVDAYYAQMGCGDDPVYEDADVEMVGGGG